MRYKRMEYNINVMRQSACLVITPITVDSCASLFNCTQVGRASDSIMGPTLIYLSWLGLYTLFLYDKIFLSDEERLTVRFYSSYRLYHDINYCRVHEIQPSTSREP